MIKKLSGYKNELAHNCLDLITDVINEKYTISKYASGRAIKIKLGDKEFKFIFKLLRDIEVELEFKPFHNPDTPLEYVRMAKEKFIINKKDWFLDARKFILLTAYNSAPNI